MVQDREGKDSIYAAPRLSLSINDFEFLRVLGEGSMATVFHAVLKNTVGDDAMLQAGKECAMKVLDKFYIQHHKMTDSVVRERHIMDKLHTNCTVRLKYTFQDTQKIYMALELYKGGDLFEQIQLRKPLPVDEARFYAAEIVLILQCLREHRVVFRDIKPENMLLDSSGHLLLTDFGCAKVLPEQTSSSCSAEQSKQDNSTSDASTSPAAGYSSESGATQDTRKVTFVGTADYLSPEVLKNTGCSFAIDLWGLGCVLFQLIAGVPPFSYEAVCRDQTAYLIMQRIDELKYEFPDDFPEDARDLVRKLLREEPSERIGAVDIEVLKAHTFFTGVHLGPISTSGSLFVHLKIL